MIKLANSIAAWPGNDFKAVLKQEIKSLDADELPLQQAVLHGSYASGDWFDVVVLSVTEEDRLILAKVGIFYGSVIAGCNCADDPTPVDEQNEYCEVVFEIDKVTAETTVSLLSE